MVENQEVQRFLLASYSLVCFAWIMSYTLDLTYDKSISIVLLLI